SGWAVPPLTSVTPTAHASVGDVSSTELRALIVPGFTVGTVVQDVPSQCSASVASRPPGPELSSPTAHASVADVAVTDWSEPLVPGVGLATTLQEVPSQCSAMVPLVPSSR